VPLKIAGEHDVMFQENEVTNSKVTGGAGEHYVAYALSCLGFMPALVREGSPAVDLLASNTSGSRTIAIQVKTAKSAVRKRGRGNERKPNHLEFTLGKKAIEKKKLELMFCFVDLKGLDPDNRPDVYVIPALEIMQYYENKDIKKHKWFRLHWSVEQMEKYKNNWEPIRQSLEEVEEI